MHRLIDISLLNLAYYMIAIVKNSLENKIMQNNC